MPARRALGVLREELAQQRRVDRAGAQRVDAHAAARELDAQLARHRQHAALGGGVGDLRGRRAHHRDERRRVDHRAAGRVVGQQVRDAVLAAQEDADLRLTSCTRCQASSVVSRTEASSFGRDAGVVEQHVDRARTRSRTRAYMSMTCCSSVTSTLSDRSPGRAGEQVDADDGRALAREQLGGRGADPAAAPVITQTLPVETPLMCPRRVVDRLDLGVGVERVRPELAPVAGLLEAAERRRSRAPSVFELIDRIRRSRSRAQTRSARAPSRVQTEPESP